MARGEVNVGKGGVIEKVDGGSRSSWTSTTKTNMLVEQYGSHQGAGWPEGWHQVCSMARQFVKGYGVVQVNSSMGSNFEGSDDQGDPRNSTTTTTNFEPDGGGIMVLAPCRITFLTGRIVFNVKLEQGEIDQGGGKSFNPLMRWVWIWQDLLNVHQIKEEQKQDTSWWPLSRSHG